MNHSFNCEIAQKIGVNAAVIFEYILFWCDKNAQNRNETAHKNGRYWVYSSVSEINEKYPYFSQCQIRYAIKKLIEVGYIEIGNFGKNKWNKSTWYSVTGAGYAAANSAEEGKEDAQEEAQAVENCEIDVRNLSDRCENNITSMCENSQIDVRNLSDRSEKIPTSKLENSQIDVKKFSNRCEKILKSNKITERNYRIQLEKEGEYDDDDACACACVREGTSDEAPFGGDAGLDPQENDTARVVSEYRKQIGEIPNGRSFEMLCSFIDDLGADAVIVAIQETNLSQPSNPWTWLCAVLNAFADSGVHDRDSAIANINDHKRKRGMHRMPRASDTQARQNYTQHEYTETDFAEENFNRIGI